MWKFFKKRAHPDSSVTTGKHRAQEIDRETTLQTSQNEEPTEFHLPSPTYLQNLEVKNILLK